MNERARSVLIGVFAGLGPLLLLDLAGVLEGAFQADPGSTSIWWPIACYVAIGAVAGFGVAAARGDRIVAAVAIGVLLLAALPTVVTTPGRWLPIPLLTTTRPAQAVAFALVGAYLYVLVRGSRA